MNLDHLMYPDVGWGYMPPTEELFDAFRHAKNRYNPKKVLEIGFHLGHSTTYQFEIYDGCQITSVSPWKDFPGKTQGDFVDPTMRWSMAIELHRLYGERWNWIPGKIQHVRNQLELQKGQFDFALIDGSHKYEAVKYDVDLCIHLGIRKFLMDNFDQSEVRRTVSDNTKFLIDRVFDYTQTFKGKTKVNQIATVEVLT